VAAPELQINNNLSGFLRRGLGQDRPACGGSIFTFIIPLFFFFWRKGTTMLKEELLTPTPHFETTLGFDR